MATYSFHGFAPEAVVIEGGGASVSIGDYIALDPYWDAADHALLFTITDFDSRFDGSGAADGDQTATVHDADGALIASGLVYISEEFTLNDGNGTVITAFAVYVDGAYAGVVTDGAMTPGIQWQITDIQTTTTANEPGYAAIEDLDYDPTVANTVDGGAYNDTLIGAAGSDLFDFSAGGDNLADGGSGSDTIYGGAGNDTLSGGSGNDTIWGAGGNDSISGDTGDDLLGGDEGNDSLYGGSGLDTLWGGLGNDYLEGGDDADVLGGGEDGDTIYGGGGNDTIWETDGDDYIDTGDGDDQIDATSGNDTIYAGTGDDYVDAGDDDDLIFFGTGADTVYGGLGNDTIDDIAFENHHVYDNYISGGGGSDVIYAGAGDDTIDGGSGADTIWGEDGADSINAGGGSDYVVFGTGADTVLGGNGADTIMDSETYDDNVYANSIAGGGGNDSIRAGSGNDTVQGDGGQDTLVGERGDDVLTGGTEDDTFRFFDESGNDTITDFDMGDDDFDGFTNDQLDITGMSALDFQQAKVWDVVTSDDGFGNAVLTFPWGETITLTGVSPSQADSNSELMSMGVPCYASGTRIMTPGGEMAIEDICVGDLVTTLAHGPQPVLWAGARHLTRDELDARPELIPILLRDGFLGNQGDLLVSPQHGMMVSGPEGDRLVRAVHLERAGDGRVRRARGRRSVSYHHLLLPRHAVILANGAPGESLYPGHFALNSMGRGAKSELFELFPRLASLLTDPNAHKIYGPTALPFAKVEDLCAIAREALVSRPDMAWRQTMRRRA